MINGEKTYISGAGDERCKLIICMVKTNPDNDRHKQHSQILIPMDTPGVEVVRAMKVFAIDDAPHGHMHLKFTDVRVPEDNIVLGPGRGFEIAQGRLGPGRTHHCMRAIGMAERALDLMCRRSVSRIAFGKPLAELGGNYDTIANARMNIDMARLLTLQTAHVIDTGGVRDARVWISKIKAVVPVITPGIIDAAVQLQCPAGLRRVLPLSARSLAAGPAARRPICSRSALVAARDVNPPPRPPPNRVFGRAGAPPTAASPPIEWAGSCRRTIRPWTRRTSWSSCYP